MALFLSTFINKIDKKGRVSVPAPFRSSLMDNSFQGFVAFRSYNQAAIEGCDIGRMERLSQSVDTLDLFSQAQEDLASTLFADAHQLAFDQDGRILLPELLREHANIKDQVAFVGRGTTFQLWHPETFKTQQEDARKRIAEQKTTLRLGPKAEEA